MATCTAAPYARASPGLMLLFNYFPLKKSWRSFSIWGMWVEPPTKTISWIWDLSSLASWRAFSIRVQGAKEQVSIQFFKLEVDSFIEGINLNTGLGAGRESALSKLRNSMEATDSPLVLPDILLVFALELFSEMVDLAIGDVFSRQVSPAIDLTSKIPSSIVKDWHIKMPPPKSKISTFLSAPTFSSKP